MSRYRPKIAFALSVVMPGLGHLYLGFRDAGASILCVLAGIIFSVLIASSKIILITMLGLYLSLAFSSARDVYHLAMGKKVRRLRNDSIFSIVMMLLLVGPFAIPMLLRSGEFSKTSKIIWTLFVVVIGALFFLTIYFFDQIIRSITDAAQAAQSRAG